MLIRLARTNREIAERILTHSSLVKCLIDQFAKVGANGDRKLFEFLTFSTVLIDSIQFQSHSHGFKRQKRLL